MSKNILLGVQLWSLRSEFQKNPEEAFRKVKGLGYDYVETAGNYGWSVEKWKEMLAETGLKVIGAHLGAADDLFKRLETEIPFQTAIGNHNYGVPSMPAEKQNAEGFKATAATLNKIADKLKSSGGVVYYHNHAFEFEKHGGKTGYEILIEETDPSKVFFQVDTFWVERMKYKAVPTLTKYASRILMVHAKEIVLETNKDTTIGKGDIDFPGVVSLAKAKKWPLIVEYEGENPLPVVKESAAYLSKLISEK